MSQTNKPTILITGGGGGIGSVAAGAFAARGYRVAVCDIRLDAAQLTVDAVRGAGGQADAYGADIGDAAQVAALFERIAADYGRLDAAFNNAGIGGGGIPLADISEEDWERNLRINLSGTWRCMKHEIRMMLNQEGGGAIVNNCSILGINGGANASYTATKHGIAGLTKSAAVSYAAKGIRVNAVCPGLIEAGLGLNVIRRGEDALRKFLSLHPIGRAGTAMEVVNAVLWLCSDEASFIHGHMMPVDGGYSSH
ncbi:SDR family oxidoreductase [Nevskia soli]|uniref:SDR family oxidoreductase n=1 Tax=Nevskia soli TaxID=418856 RepID=UPI0004A6D9D6|nr:SDR family oxidoreductase [Nevskia soli]